MKKDHPSSHFISPRLISSSTVGWLPKRMRRYFWYFLIVIGLIVLSVMVWYFGSVLNEPNYFSQIQKKTAIIVLGGGLTDTGKVPIHTQFRLDRAVEIYRKKKEKNEQVKIITLSGGTTHKPNPRDSDGFVVWEASAAAQRLLEMGIPAIDVYEENFSLDTIGNAYFLRSIHLTPGKFTHAIIITNNWHMDRTKSIFETVLSLPDELPTYPNPTTKKYKTDQTEEKEEEEEDFDEIEDWIEWFFFHKRRKINQTRTPLLSLDFEAVESGISDPMIYQARVDREQKSLKSFNQQLKEKWQTWEELHHWLFTEHNAYASQRLSQKKRNIIDSEVLKTY